MDWALQRITQKKSKRIKKSVAWGLLVKLLKKGHGQCRKKMADPANHVLPDPGSGMLTPREEGEKYGAGEPVFCGGKRVVAAATALGRS